MTVTPSAAKNGNAPVNAGGTRDIRRPASRVGLEAPKRGAKDHDSRGDDMSAPTIATSSPAAVNEQARETCELEWRPAVPGNAGHSLDCAPLPYWLDRPCPPWCRST